MKIKNILFRTLQIIMLVLVFSACEKTSAPGVLETPKSLDGDWKVIKVLQNTIDITSELDLTPFVIKFTGDTYTLQNQTVPFIVSKNGKWNFNNPENPFSLYFTPEGAAAPVKSELAFPIVGDNRQVTITFDAGCNRNIYQYTLAKP